MADFYLDENVDSEFASLLTARGHTVFTTAQADRLGTTDDRQLLFATDLGRILITHDERDYRFLCGLWRNLAKRWGINDAAHAGVLVIPQRLPFPYNHTASEILYFFILINVVWGE